MEPTTESTTSSAATAKGLNADEIKAFYKNSFPAIFKAVFAEPMDGTCKLFVEQGPDRYRQSITLIASAAITGIVLMYVFMPGMARSYVPFKSYLGLGLGVALLLVVISVLSYLIKLSAGKADLKQELLTGALCGLPIIVAFVVIATSLSLMGDSITNISYDPMGALSKATVPLLAALFAFLLMSNIMQQSLRAHGVKDPIAWYSAPVAIGVSFYLTEKLFAALFM